MPLGQEEKRRTLIDNIRTHNDSIIIREGGLDYINSSISYLKQID